MDLDNPRAPATSSSIENVGGEEGQLRIIQGATTKVTFSPVFCEGGSYLLRSEGLIVGSE